MLLRPELLELNAINISLEIKKLFVKDEFLKSFIIASIDDTCSHAFLLYNTY